MPSKGTQKVDFKRILRFGARSSLSSVVMFWKFAIEKLELSLKRVTVSRYLYHQRC